MHNQFIFFNENPDEWYLKRVYRAWNYAVKMCKSKIICLVQTDMQFHPNWLEGMLKYLKPKTIVGSMLVEPAYRKANGIDVFPNMFEGNFGITPETFREEDYLKFVSEHKREGTVEFPKGPYAPLLAYKEDFLSCGGFPEGNIGGDETHVGIPADEWYFDKLKSRGIKHVISKETIPYHIKEGEMVLG